MAMSEARPFRSKKSKKPKKTIVALIETTKIHARNVRGACKIKLKKVNEKRRVTVRRVICVVEYLKASIADLITLLSSSVHKLERLWRRRRRR
jgi:hypothetical protein